MKEKLQKLIKDDRGADMVEYIIAVAVIALVAIAAFRVFEKAISSKTNQKAGEVNAI